MHAAIESVLVLLMNTYSIRRFHLSFTYIKSVSECRREFYFIVSGEISVYLVKISGINH